jgi:outer membrane receptor protein involved in Fe transport
MKSLRHIATQPKISVPMAVSLVLACAAQMRVATVAAQSSGGGAGDEDGQMLQEVTVTANRREESLLSVPYNISAVTGSELQRSGAVDVQSLSTMVPGLQAPNEGLRGGQLPQFTIRGLNVSPNGDSSNLPGGEAPLVSVYSDNTPLEANLKMTDIQRVEILRGPQSTLYGSGAVGGTVRLIHNQPDPTQTEFQMIVDGSKTQHAAHPSGSVDTIFNIPFSDAMALRGSVGWEGRSGYTDALSLVSLDRSQQPILADPNSPLTSGLAFHRENGVDNGTVWYARLAGLYELADVAQISLTYQHQETYAGDYPFEQPGLRYEQNRYFKEWLKNHTDLAALDVSLDAGFATISSTSSFTNQHDRSVYDETGLIEELDPILYGNYPRVSSPLFNHDGIRTLTEELRLTSKDNGPVRWVAGAWYSYQFAENGTTETIPGYASWAALPGTGSPAGCTVYDAVSCPAPTFDDVLQNLYDATPPSNPLAGKPADGVYYYQANTYFHDFSPLYGEVSYHLTPKWQVTGGGRIILQRFSENILQVMPVCGAACSQSQADPTGTLTASSATTFHKQVFKANTSYEVNPDTLLYYTWSQGFRRGGANGLPFGDCLFCVPASQLTYQPDVSVNNEVGIKGRVSQLATYTITLFNINWQHPQISATEPLSGLGFISNAGTARSRGLESEISVQRSRHMHLALGYAYTDAKLTSNFTVGNGAFVGESGDRLPGVSKQQVSAALDYEAPFVQTLSFHAHADAAYRSNFWTETPRSTDTALLSGYTLVNARSGVSIDDRWRLDAYVSNITNSQGISGYTYIAAFLPHNYAYMVARPRTVGLQLNYFVANRK